MAIVTIKDIVILIIPKYFVIGITINILTIKKEYFIIIANKWAIKFIIPVLCIPNFRLTSCHSRTIELVFP